MISCAARRILKAVAGWLHEQFEKELRRLIKHFAAHGLSGKEIREVVEGVMPSESDTPAPSLPGPPLA